MIDNEKNYDLISEIILGSKNIKLVPGGIFTKYYFNKIASYKTSDTINSDDMKFACDYLGHTITENENIGEIYSELMDKYIAYHKLI